MEVGLLVQLTLVLFCPIAIYLFDNGCLDPYYTTPQTLGHDARSEVFGSVYHFSTSDWLCESLVCQSIEYHVIP